MWEHFWGVCEVCAACCTPHASTPCLPHMPHTGVRHMRKSVAQVAGSQGGVCACRAWDMQCVVCKCRSSVCTVCASCMLCDNARQHTSWHTHTQQTSVESNAARRWGTKFLFADVVWWHEYVCVNIRQQNFHSGESYTEVIDVLSIVVIFWDDRCVRTVHQSWSANLLRVFRHEVIMKGCTESVSVITTA